MGVAGRFWNFVKGLFWQGQRNLEKANPEAVYEMAILKMKEQYQKMHAAVGRLAAERNRLRSKVETSSAQLAEVQADLDGALGRSAGGQPGRHGNRRGPGAREGAARGRARQR